MIVRDEAARLPRALSSVRAVADEIVVADTGSKDGTPDLARQAGARVIEFPWCDDFAAAINHVVAHARGEWVLRLDADEELMPDCHDALSACLQREDAFAYLLLRRDLSDADVPERFSEMWVDRLHRNRPGVQYVGRCHAHPTRTWEALAADEGRQVCKSDVRLTHTGYIESLRGDKLRRAARLLELELLERPGQFYYQVELANTLLLLGEARGYDVLRDALRKLVEHANDALPPSPMAILALDCLLVPDSKRPSMPLTQAQGLALARRWFPDSVQLLWRAAQSAFGIGDFAVAAAALERLLSLGESGTYDRSVSFDPRICGDDARLNLGVCLVRLFRLSEAETCFESLLESTTAGDQALQNLNAVKTLKGQQNRDSMNR